MTRQQTGDLLLSFEVTQIIPIGASDSQGELKQLLKRNSQAEQSSWILVEEQGMVASDYYGSHSFFIGKLNFFANMI